MRRIHTGTTWTSRLTADSADGWAAVELLRGDPPAKTPVMRVVFWDAAGQFAVETAAGEVPLAIVEALIEEAKAAMKTR